MYGLIIEGLREQVTAERGEAVWNEIARRAGTSTIPFVAMQAYDDAIVYSLVEATGAVLGLPPEVVLERFGEHWVAFAASRGYDSLLDLCGRDLGEFLGQMESLHNRVKLALPNLDPPVMTVARVDTNAIRLRYSSKRQGLAPLLVGIVRGLAKRFNVTVAIAHEVRRAEGQADEFLIRWAEAA